MYATNNTLQGGCAFGIFYDFKDHEKRDYYEEQEKISDLIPKAGTGIVMACFIQGDKLCDDVFAECAKRGDVLFVSEPRENRNTGNVCYLAVFDFSENETAKYGFDDYDNAQEDD